MFARYGFVFILVLLVLSGATVLVGETEQGVNLSSVMEIWADVLRDVDQFGFTLTRVSDQEEMRVGKEVSRSVMSWWREDPGWTPYVSAVGVVLLPYMRRKGIQYQFHAIESGWINAFALPGGQIFITTGMLKFLQSEAELAAILGHEISHVDLRHCIERFQYELTLHKVELGELGKLAEIGRRLLTVGYTKYQELEADAQGVRLSIAAGYNPEAGAIVFDRLQRHFHERTPPQATTPVEELTQAMTEAMGSYLRSHPPFEERKRRLQTLVARNRIRLSGRTFYNGVENYQQRIPRSQQEFSSEMKREEGPSRYAL